MSAAGWLCLLAAIVFAVVAGGPEVTGLCLICFALAGLGVLLVEIGGENR